MRYLKGRVGASADPWRESRMSAPLHQKGSPAVGSMVDWRASPLRWALRDAIYQAPGCRQTAR